MEVMVFGMRREDGRIVLDLGIQSLAGSGLEIQKEAQFILLVDDEEVYIDEDATAALSHHPPLPFTVPPGTFLRFELAYQTESIPTSLYFRGYESENSFILKKL
jgi:hypothetical protein